MARSERSCWCRAWIWTWATTCSSAGTHLYMDGRVSFWSRPVMLRLRVALLPSDVCPAARTLSVIGLGEFRRPLRQIERSPSVSTVQDPSPGPSTDAAASVAAAAAPPLDWVVTACPSPRRPRGACGPRGGTSTGGPRPAPPWPPALASPRRALRRRRLANAKLHLQGADDVVFATLNHRFATCWAGLRRACRRTAVCSSSFRRATRLCPGPAQ